MKNLILALMFMYSGAVLAADNPDWAYPVNPPPPQVDAVTLKSVPGSTKHELMKQVVEKLDDNDMIALSAYLGSLDP